MVLMGVVLQTASGARKAHKILRRIMRYLDRWDIGQPAALCNDTVVEIQSLPDRTTKDCKEMEASNFNSKAKNGRIQADVRGLQGQGQSRVLFSGDADTNTGRPVTEILQ